jgi:serine/threonine-protein phosphatase 2B catalytic subunit
MFPQVITIFSAPNYCDFYNNKGACLLLSDKELLIEQYTEVEHPYTLPDYMDIFEWSFPFVAQKIG